MAKLKYRSDDGFEEIGIQGPILSTWVNFGNVPAYHTVTYLVDFSGFGYVAEPQVWFQPYQGAACVSVGNVSATQCSLWCYNPTNGEAPMSGWLKSCSY